MGPIKHFLGISVHRNQSGFFLSQAQYAADLLERTGMASCNVVTTLADTKPKASAADERLLTDATTYRSIVGALQYLTITRPDIAYAMQQVCLHMHAPHDDHQTMLKWILRYVKGTSNLGIQLRTTPTVDDHYILRCRLGWLPGHPIYIQLLCIPRQLSHLVVIKKTGDNFQIKRRG